MSKVFETLDPQVCMNLVSLCGMAGEQVKLFLAVDEKDIAARFAEIADWFSSRLVEEVVPEPVGIRAVLREGERIGFHTIRSRFGFDTKTTHKIIREAMKNGDVVADGAGRAKRYSLTS